MSRDAVFQDEFREDLLNWVRADPRTARRIFELGEAVMREPSSGIGKPEQLKHLPGVMSRRVTQEHRLVYRVTETRIDFLQCRYHYE